MEYKIRRTYIDNKGNTTYAKRAETIIWPKELRIGGLYQLRTGKLYRVEEKKED